VAIAKSSKLYRANAMRSAPAHLIAALRQTYDNRGPNAFDEDAAKVFHVIGWDNLQRICAALADPADHRRAAEKAYGCGLADQAQFIRAFRRGYGMTPVEYRAAMLSAEMPHAKARDRIRRG